MSKPDNLSRYLDVDFLREQASEDPHWFGLGFIQLKLNDRMRMHFWHPALTKDVPDEELHNHRYNFISHILRGQMTNECWDFVSGHSDEPKEMTHELVDVTCKPGEEGEPQVQDRGYPHFISSHTMRQGNHYYMQADTYHRLKVDHAVTLLTREEITKTTAQVIRDPKEPFVCPFSNPMPVEQLWDYIRQCCQGFPNGYHSWDIPKGVVGESSKIFEEVLELQDAERQGNRVMATCELADLYGSLEMYLEHNHPDLTMGDLQTMAHATRGAFERGER